MNRIFLISQFTFNLTSADKYNWINLFTKSGDLNFFISAPRIKHDMFWVYMTTCIFVWFFLTNVY